MAPESDIFMVSAGTDLFEERVN